MGWRWRHRFLATHTPFVPLRTSGRTTKLKLDFNLSITLQAGCASQGVAPMLRLNHFLRRYVFVNTHDFPTLLAVDTEHMSVESNNLWAMADADHRRP